MTATIEFITALFCQVDDPEHGRGGQEGLRPVVMGHEETKEPRRPCTCILRINTTGAPIGYRRNKKA